MSQVTCRQNTGHPDFTPEVWNRLQNLEWTMRDCCSQHPVIYERSFTHEEREHHPFHEVTSLVDLWRTCHPNSNHYSALVELGRRGGIIEQSTYEFLMREISEGYSDRSLFQSNATPELPVWNEPEGVLYLGGDPVRRFESTSRARACVRVLNEFQSQHWPPRLEVSTEIRRYHPRLDKIVRSLNSGLIRIRFTYCQNQAIMWNVLPVEPNASPPETTPNIGTMPATEPDEVLPPLRS